MEWFLVVVVILLSSALYANASQEKDLKEYEAYLEENCPGYLDDLRDKYKSQKKKAT